MGEPVTNAEPTDLPVFEPIVITDAHVLAPGSAHPGMRTGAFRLISDGYGSIAPDRDLGDLMQVRGYLICSRRPAIAAESAYVGTMAGPMEEIWYTLPNGERRYLYLVTSSEIDSYAQDFWSSSVRLSAEVASDAIREARQRTSDIMMDLVRAQGAVEREMIQRHGWPAMEWDRTAEQRQAIRNELYARGLIMRAAE
jgi:hypothetical protein